MFSKLVDAVFKDRYGYVGRKLTAAWALTLLVTFLMLIPVLVSLFTLFTTTIPALLTAEAYSTILVAIWGTFFASDTVNKWIYNVKSNDNKPTDAS